MQIGETNGLTAVIMHVTYTIDYMLLHKSFIHSVFIFEEKQYVSSQDWIKHGLLAHFRILYANAVHSTIATLRTLVIRLANVMCADEAHSGIVWETTL